MKRVILLAGIFVVLTAAGCTQRGSEICLEADTGHEYVETTAEIGEVTTEITEKMEAETESEISTQADLPPMVMVDGVLFADTGKETEQSLCDGVSLVSKNRETDGISEWGVTLSVKNITAEGLTLVCTQGGGSLTGDLQTGEDYRVEVLQNDVWTEVPYIIDNFGWNELAWVIPDGETVEWEIDWMWLYGQLAPGQYRLVKEFMDFRKTADYDIREAWVEFEIELPV